MEKWHEFYTQEELEKVQKIEKNSLEYLLHLCCKIGVTPIMYGGTLIGVVRHKGFVPWDDDIDVAMSRKDYDKFIGDAPKFLSEEYQLQVPQIEPNTPYFYAKLRRKNTEYVEYVHHRLKMSKGIYIDIYPIDNIPDDDDEYEKFYKKVQKRFNLYVMRQSPYLSKPAESIKDVIRASLKFIVSKSLRAIPLYLWIMWINNLLTRYNDVKTKRKSVLNYPKKENWYEELYPLVEGFFEGNKVLIPGDWREHLTRRYGNYMEMPPESERIGHKPFLLKVE